MTTPGGNQGLPAAFQSTVLGLGGLETAVGGRPSPAGGAQAMFQTAQSQEVQIVRDDALAALISGLREDFARWIDMQKTFNDDKSRELDSLREQMRAQKQDIQAQQVARASGLSEGNATAGMTTTSGMGKGMMPPLPAMNAMGMAFPGMYGFFPQPTNGTGYLNTAWPSQFSPAGVRATGAGSGGPGSPSSPGGPGGSSGGGGGYGGGGGGGASPQGQSGGAQNPGNHLKATAQAGGIGAAGKMILSGKPGGMAAGLAMLSERGYQEVLSQMRANQRIMEVQGGDNTDAMKERGSAFFDRYRHLSLSGDEYKQMTGLAQTMGYRGSDREQVVKEMNSWKNKMGISGEESAKYIDQAARTTRMSLDQLGKSLEGVTEAARDAHMNAKQLRAEWSADIDKAYSNGAGRQAASGFADVNSEYRTQLGKGYENFSLSGASQFRSRSIAAAALGLTPTQLYEAQQRSPQTGAGIAQDALVGTAVRSVPEAVKKYILDRAAKPPALIKADLINDGVLSANHLDPESLAIVMSNVTSSPVNADQAIEVLINFVVKDGHPFQSAAKESIKAKGWNENAGITKGKEGELQGGSGNRDRLGHGDYYEGHTHWYNPLAGRKKDWVSTRVGDWQDKNKATSGVLQAITTDANLRKNPHVEFQVHGQQTTMKLDQAIKEYPEIIMAGEYLILEGADAQKTGKEALGGYSDSTAGTLAKVKEIEGGKGKVKGEGVKSFEDWQKDHPDGKGGKESGGTSVGGGTFTLTPEASKLLALIPKGTNPLDSSGQPMPLGGSAAGWGTYGQ